MLGRASCGLVRTARIRGQRHRCPSPCPGSGQPARYRPATRPLTRPSQMQHAPAGRTPAALSVGRGAVLGHLGFLGGGFPRDASRHKWSSACGGPSPAAWGPSRPGLTAQFPPPTAMMPEVGGRFSTNLGGNNLACGTHCPPGFWGDARSRALSRSPTQASCGRPRGSLSASTWGPAEPGVGGAVPGLCAVCWQGLQGGAPTRPGALLGHPWCKASEVPGPQKLLRLMTPTHPLPLGVPRHPSPLGGRAAPGALWSLDELEALHAQQGWFCRCTEPARGGDSLWHSAPPSAWVPLPLAFVDTHRSGRYCPTWGTSCPQREGSGCFLG